MGAIAILMPVFDDWEAATLLLDNLDVVLGDGRMTNVIAVVVNDGSSEPIPEAWDAAPRLAIREVRVVELARNLGHQRAIACGLTYIAQNVACERVVVMDCDGEDRAEDVPALLESGDGRTVVFAARAKRLESITFRIFYQLYRLAHWLLTGISVRVGNFSVIPFGALDRLTHMGEIWNHYAAAVFLSRIPYATVPLGRGRRLAGASKMNLVALAVHGFSAISVFTHAIAVRLFFATMAALVLATAGIVTVVGVRVGTSLAIPGWATTLVGMLAIVLVQLLTFSMILIFLVLGARNSATFLPARDCPAFIRSVRVMGARRNLRMGLERLQEALDEDPVSPSHRQPHRQETIG